MPSGVIFDMDGVLVDSMEAHLESWMELGRRYRLEISRDVFHDTFGRAGRDIVRMMWGEGIDASAVHARVAEKESIYRDRIRGAAPLMPGVREVVADLHDAGFRLAVGTSGPIENVQLILTEAGIGDRFQGVVTGFDVERGKPAPDVFLLAASRLELGPERCAVVEDAPVGVEAAVAAGMPAVGLAGMHSREALRAAGAARAVASLDEITPDVIANLLEEG
jgi:beta-phosphoglucomutase